MKASLHFIFTLVCFVFIVSTGKAQNTDLPNPNKNIKTLPVGSFIIAMDKTNQSRPGYFNLRAYGMVVNLLNAGVRLRWVIDSGKVQNGTDISVLADQVYPSYVAGGSVRKNFLAGPFVIFSSDTTTASIIINIYNSLQTTANRVNVYRTLEAVDVNVRYDYVGVNKPKAAILNDGGNASIQSTFMANADIPTTNYAVLDSAVNLYAGCYTFASEPHNDGSGGFPIARIVDSLKDFVSKGGNFLAQCHAIPIYENFNQVQSSLGVTGGGTGNNLYKTTTVLIPTANVNYANPDMSYGQFDGSFTPNQTGFMQTWTRFPGSVALNNFYPVINGNTAATDSIFGATVSKHRSGKGGLIFYLGNHDFKNATTDAVLNGQRMYLNAFLTPAAYGNCPLYQCTGPECGPLPIILKYFTAKKINTLQVQLNWTTTTEFNTKEYVIERSNDGFSFVGIGRIYAHGLSNSEINYNYKDLSPAKGYNYYRLTEVSNDGKTNNSEVVSVFFSGNNLGLEIYPSPARQLINVDMNGLTMNNNVISVYNLTGKTLIDKMKVNGNTAKLDVSGFSAGTYILRATDINGTVLQSKFVVIKK